MAPTTASPPTRPPPLPILGRLLEPLYRFEINRRNRNFDAAKGVTRLPIPVISVGNLTVGGTGKTPMVARIVRWLRDAGHDPCIAMRGYKSKHAESDEAQAYTRAFDDLPLVAQPDRLAGLRTLFETLRGNRIDCVVLDDGFQHRRIARDLDIVLLDASQNPFGQRLLPAGWLREPVTSLARAHAAVVTHAELIDAPMTRELWFPLTLRLGKHKPIALTRHTWTELDVQTNGMEQRRPVEWLQGKSTLAVCAIGNPWAFIRAVQNAVGEDAAKTREQYGKVLTDHDKYIAKRIAEIMTLAHEKTVDAIVTTDKDWSKLRHVAADRWPCPVVRPRLELAFDRGEEDLKRLVLTTASHQRARSASEEKYRQ